MATTDNQVTFQAVLNEMGELYQRKNADYGNSFDMSLDEFGVIAAVVRMNDKMNRLKSLCKHDAQVTSESIADTVLDLANYSAMTYRWIKQQHT